jgi:transposase
MRTRAREIDPELLEALREKVKRGLVNQEALRARIVLAYFEGSSYTEIHETYGWSADTTAKWLKRFRAEGLAGLRRRSRATPPSRVRSLLATWLPTVVHKSPRSLGREQERWTLEALQIVCEEQTGERLGQESIRLALHRFGHSWKRAKRTITSPDPEYEGKRGHCSLSSSGHQEARA